MPLEPISVLSPPGRIAKSGNSCAAFKTKASVERQRWRVLERLEAAKSHRKHYLQLQPPTCVAGFDPQVRVRPLNCRQVLVNYLILSRFCCPMVQISRIL